jgi:hypothetical protein
LTLGKYTHDFPITFSQAEKLGFKVRQGVPREIYKLLEFYPTRS